MITAATLGITLLASACSSSPSSGNSADSSSQPYHVLALLALSGPDSANGMDLKRGIEIAVKDVNASGGIDGHQVSITYQDDQGSGTQAVSLVQSALASSTEPQMVIAALSEDQVPIAPILMKQNILLIGAGRPQQLADTSKYRLVFDTAPDPVDIASAELTYAADHGWTHIGMLASNNAFGESQTSGFKQAAQSTSIKVTYETYNATATDATSNLQQLQGSHPQAVFYTALGPIAGTILKDRTILGWTVPFVGDAGVAVNNVAAMVPAADVKGVVIEEQRNTVADATGVSPAFAHFYSQLKAQGPITDPVTASGYGYDVLRIVQAGAKIAHSTDSTKIAEALESMPADAAVTWVSKNGPLGFTKSSNSLHYLYSDFIFAPVAPLKDGLISVSS
jgi:branched-chain amino acid transport system substrate-binding protein